MIEKRSQRARDGRCVFVVPDLHCPHHDEHAVGVAQDFCQDIDPDAIVFLGDAWDFYDLSSFSKDPDRRFRLQNEFDAGREVIEGFVHGRTRQRYFLLGNHEARFQRYLRDKAPELHSLRSLSLTKLAGLDSLGFDVWEYGDGFSIGDAYFTHGNLVSKHSAYTAKRHFTDLGGSIHTGHSHRMSHFSKTDLQGEHHCYEHGHLADPDPEYINGVANWQQGWGVVWVDEDDGTAWTDQVLFQGGRAMYRGTVWK